MTQLHRHLRLWFVLALVLVLIAAGALWLRGARLGSDQSPLPTPMIAGVSPLATSTPEDDVSSPPSSWANGGAILLWVALGILLALGIAFIILRWYRGAV